jgi:transcriptional regulator GlxA family with amidase domain
MTNNDPPACCALFVAFEGMGLLDLTEGVTIETLAIRLVDWLAVHAPRARRTASDCAGAFLLAEAGLLDDRRAVTHRASCELLDPRYGNLTVEPDAIFAQDGPIWTSAGVSAGIDLSLALVQEDCGRDIAN